ncbi:hypothetical protein P280DRAFT_526778 [Massarina eburnea CBS 473.64]|uniref:Uncharacterized protein n=1 Tax=Massarina eburnea CBS 473.64 TaxID=1395130 RepID=A0A6A6RZQ3_9PLEO|nr:hypothetical protein P280DRAFT_526778 [Massarina eburnea CBS 473.64]
MLPIHMPIIHGPPMPMQLIPIGPVPLHPIPMGPHMAIFHHPLPPLIPIFHHPLPILAPPPPPIPHQSLIPHHLPPVQRQQLPHHHHPQATPLAPHIRHIPPPAPAILAHPRTVYITTYSSQRHGTHVGARPAGVPILLSLNATAWPAPPEHLAQRFSGLNAEVQDFVGRDAVGGVYMYVELS